MSEQEKDFEENGSQVSIANVLYITLRHWPWILVSLAVCVGLAVAYLLRTQPVYTRSASLVIKDESKGKSVTSELDAFSDMGLISSNNNINDEINKLQSNDVMLAVVRRLGLQMNYSVPGRFHRDYIYGATLPVNVNFISLLDEESASANLSFDKDGKSYKLTDLKRDGESIDWAPEKPMQFGDTINTPVGAVCVSKTDYFRPVNVEEILVSRSPMSNTVSKYEHELSISHKNDKSNTIDITVNDVLPQRAEDLINTIIDIYNENWIDNRNQISVSTSNFINERLAAIERELGTVDNDISSYQSANLIPDVQQAASIYMAENQAANAQMLDLNNQLQMTRYMREYLTNASNRNQVLPANSGINNAAVEQQIAEYNEKLLQRNKYADNSSETHPMVVDMDAEIAGMRGSIISSIDNQIVALNTQMRNLQGSKSRTQAQIASNPTQAKYLLSVERQQKVKEALYLFLLQKREENELSQAFTAYNTQLIARPHGPLKPIAPRTMMILAVAFIIGLAIPFGVTFLRETLNTRVRGRKDLEGISVPLVGEVPLDDSVKGQKESSIIVSQGNRNIVNEAFRVIRTNLGFMTPKDGRCTVVMVTSFNAGSGKSFVVLNLAMSMALRGKRVLVIDGDMRHASTSMVVDSPKKGMSNYLAGKVDDIDGIIVRDRYFKGFDILPVGTIPPNPTELLESERFSEMIDTLRSYYDYIFIDCPPVEMMADAQIVGKLSDRTLFIVRAGLLERSMLQQLQRYYEEKKLPNIGIILNGTSMDGSKFGYKYGYGFGYHYGEYGTPASEV